MKKKGLMLSLTVAIVLALVVVAVAMEVSHKSNLQMELSTTTDLGGGDELTVTVTNKDVLPLNALTFHVDFNPEALTVTNVTFKINGEAVSAPAVNGSVVSGGECSTVTQANESGKVGFYYLTVTENESANGFTAAKDNGVVATITFRAKRGLTATQTDLLGLYEDSASKDGWFNLRKEDGYKAADAEVSFSGVDPDYVLGDVTGEGDVTAADVTALLRHVAKIELLSDEFLAAGDIVGNDGINAADVTKLLRYVSRIDLSLD